MLEHLQPQIEELEQRTEAVNPQERKQLKAILEKSRELLKEPGTFHEVDQILNNVATRIAYLQTNHSEV